MGRPRLIVGLTGGIGSGKSSAARCFRELGVPVIDADEIAREVVQPGEPALEEIVRTFGREMLDSAGHLQRRRLRQRVFEDDAARRRLEAILHPPIRERMLQRLRSLDAPYAVLVIPLLLETHQEDLVDRILVVDVPEEVQIERVTQRDRSPPEQVRRILETQATRRQRLAAADDVIDNSGAPESLCPRVRNLHKRYLALAAAVGDGPTDGTIS